MLRYWTASSPTKNTRDATLSSKDIAISTYTKGEIGNNNDNNNIVSSLVHILTE